MSFKCAYHSCNKWSNQSRFVRAYDVDVRVRAAYPEKLKDAVRDSQLDHIARLEDTIATTPL